MSFVHKSIWFEYVWPVVEVHRYGRGRTQLLRLWLLRLLRKTSARKLAARDRRLRLTQGLTRHIYVSELGRSPRARLGRLCSCRVSLRPRRLRLCEFARCGSTCGLGSNFSTRRASSRNSCFCLLHGGSLAGGDGGNFGSRHDCSCRYRLGCLSIGDGGRRLRRLLCLQSQGRRCVRLRRFARRRCRSICRRTLCDEPCLFCRDRFGRLLLRRRLRRQKLSR
mmetsp:Transcript_22568/g.53476  ORF Transcript_22568/g.53476 Transcript_22568/m.53476 type:complete len:222 (+) Transcript_22568:217-882(+)